MNTHNIFPHFSMSTCYQEAIVQKYPPVVVPASEPILYLLINASLRPHSVLRSEICPLWGDIQKYGVDAAADKAAEDVDHCMVSSVLRAFRVRKCRNIYATFQGINHHLQHEDIHALVSMHHAEGREKRCLLFFFRLAPGGYVCFDRLDEFTWRGRFCRPFSK